VITINTGFNGGQGEFEHDKPQRKKVKEQGPL